jgi:hypothetical protein
LILLHNFYLHLIIKLGNWALVVNDETFVVANADLLIVGFGSLWFTGCLNSDNFS